MIPNCLRYRYNRDVKKALLVSLALIAAACSKADIDNKDAVRAAMIDYLDAQTKQTGLDPATMDINVNAVAFERDTARATVSFLIKGTQSGMQMNYTLTRSGNKWQVTGKDTASGPHPIVAPGDAPGLPAGHPPTVESGKSVESGKK